MFNDIYFGMHVTFSGHPDDLYNGEYIAHDYLYMIWGYPSPFVHFRNTNGMYLYYYPFDGENKGYWNLNDNES